MHLVDANNAVPCNSGLGSSSFAKAGVSSFQFKWLAVLAAFLFAIFAPAAQAQYKASLRGTVADQTGAVVPGATVTLQNKETNETKTSTSDGAGIYTFNALPPAASS